MSDLYTELLIKRKKTSTDNLLKYGLMGLTVLAGAAGIFLSPYVLIVFGALILVDYFKLASFELEFEYLYVNGELDIDKIMSKAKRKRIASYRVEQAELIAPFKSHELDYYRQDKNIRIQDYSSGEENANVYAMITNEKEKREMVLLELNDVILNDMRRIAPRKVKLS